MRTTIAATAFIVPALAYPQLGGLLSGLGSGISSNSDLDEVRLQDDGRRRTNGSQTVWVPPGLGDGEFLIDAEAI